MDWKRQDKIRNPLWIKNALCFHGKPMKKTWADEHGNDDLHKVGVIEDDNYTVYMERQKYFTFQDRAKRLKIHQFLAQKSEDLYDSKQMKSEHASSASDLTMNKCKF